MVLIRLADVHVQDVHHICKLRYDKKVLNKKRNQFDKCGGIVDGDLMCSKKRNMPRTKANERRAPKRSRNGVSTNEHANRAIEGRTNDRTYGWGRIDDLEAECARVAGDISSLLERSPR